MSLTTAARDLIAQALAGESFTAYNNASSHIGVGNGANAFLADDTDLKGTSKLRKPMEATYPQRVGPALSFRSLFGIGDANFNWEEWGVFNAATAGEMLNRKVESLGSKTSVQSWQLTVTVTLEVVP